MNFRVIVMCDQAVANCWLGQHDKTAATPSLAVLTFTAAYRNLSRTKKENLTDVFLFLEY